MNYFKEQNQEVNKVYRTNDLSIFNQVKGNRPPNPQHIKRLCHSIKTNGVLQNPIIVNQDMDIIDGQHRLLAAKEASSSVFYIIVDGYSLKEVQVLNLSQKNWNKTDFLNGYADMGVKPYVKLRDFIKENKDFTITNCIAMCSNRASFNSDISSKYRHDTVSNQKEVFEEGTWKGRDFNLAQENANKIRMVKNYYDGYKRSVFVSAMLSLFQNENFNHVEFLNKLKLQQGKLQDCSNVAQYKILIEDIYNYRRRGKVNLRF